jgi:hypothetical protein
MIISPASIKEGGKKKSARNVGHYYNVVFKGFMLIFTAMLLFLYVLS